MKKLSVTIKGGATRTAIAISLGCLWLIDGLFQLQPKMFTPNFANNVLGASAQNQPAIVSVPMNEVIRLVLTDPIFFGITFAVVQFLLGALILWRRTRTFGLVCSCLWALLVWYLGEGMGGLLTGQAELLTGFPGAALIYCLLSVAALPKPKDPRMHSMPPAWLNIAWAVVWIGGAIYQLLPGQNSTFNIASTITQIAGGAPGWLGAINARIAVMTSHGGLWLILFLALIEVGIAIAVFMPDYIRRHVLYVSIILSLVFWVVGQDLGGWYTGVATDPNAGPLFVLFAVALLGSDRLMKWPKDL